MPGLASPAEMRAYIIERLVGETGEPDQISVAARRLLEKAAPTVAEVLSGVLSQTVEVEPGDITLTRFSEARPAETTGYALCVASGANSPEALALGLDADALGLLVGAFFGGDAALPVSPIHRELSPIELGVATAVLNGLAQGVNDCGHLALGLRLPLNAAMTGVELRKLALRDGPAVRMTFAMTMAGRPFTATMAMPQRLLRQQSGNATAGATVDWGAHINEEVMRSSITLQAMMPIGRKTLGDLAELEIGHVLEIDEGAQGNATLAVRNRTLFLCEFGKLGQHYTLRVRQPFDAEQDLLDNLVRK
ncbi:MAG: FliM/FliN family flagellar motor switch protein [Rhizobiaceae bacterium]|nr:FliM/FliN family flagellar motor switch protein [Rhizobiaceae bacterium]